MKLHPADAVKPDVPVPITSSANQIDIKVQMTNLPKLSHPQNIKHLRIKKIEIYFYNVMHITYNIDQID
jgi:hypothetical protein